MLAAANQQLFHRSATENVNSNQSMEEFKVPEERKALPPAI